MTQYRRLRGQLGYTGGAADPVFLQDKIEYLFSLDEDDYLPTLKVVMPTLSSDKKVEMWTSQITEIEKFVSNNSKKFKDGWVVKTPFTTHGSPYRGNIYCKSLEEVMKRIQRLAYISAGVKREGDNRKLIQVTKILN